MVFERDLGKVTLARWMVVAVMLAEVKAGSNPFSTKPHEIE